MDSACWKTKSQAAAEKPTVSSLLAALKECSGSRDLERGKEIHSQAVHSGLIHKIKVANSLIRAFGRCGSMADAHKLFDNLLQRNVVSWNCLIQGYADCGNSETALQIFQGMQEAPDARTYLAALTACSRRLNGNAADQNRRWLEKGKEIHSQAVTNRCCNIFVESLLVEFYAKCGRMIEARSVFDNMNRRDAVAWNSLIKGYVDNADSELALELFDAMENSGCVPVARTYVAALTACADLASRKFREKNRWLEAGKRIHSRSVMNRCCNIFVESMLVDLYSRCGSMADARSVFDGMIQRDVVSWNCLIKGYVDNGDGELALELFDRMQEDFADSRTYLAALTACAALAEKCRGRDRRWFDKGQAIHFRAVKNRCCSVFVESLLVDMYAKCGKMLHARKVFDQMLQTTVVSWNSLIQGYVDNGESQVALELFEIMEEGRDGCFPDGRSYVAALTACAALAAEEDRSDGRSISRWLAKGQAIHSAAVKNRCCDLYVENTLINMFGSCGSMVDARAVFDSMRERDVISWTVLVQGYINNGQSKLALELFDEMERSEGARFPDPRTYVAALQACSAAASESNGKLGKFIESSSNKIWLDKAAQIFSNALRNNCADTFVWNCIVWAYADNGENKQALELLIAMDLSGFSYNPATFVAALTACGNIMALEIGEAYHDEIQSCGLAKDLAVATCLVEFYGKCGSMRVAKQVFDSIDGKDVWAWNALICGYSQQGDASEVFRSFQRMRDGGLWGNEFTFTHILTVCSHAGLTVQGREYFDAMQTRYGVRRDLIHYTCLVDMLARANCIDEAVKVVESMPWEADAVTWAAILGACHKWENVEAGKMAYEALLRLAERDAAPYVLMANIFGMNESTG